MCVSVHTAPQWCGSCHEHHPTDWLGRCPFGTSYIPRSSRVHVVCMPTRSPPVHTTAPTSAYPGHYPRPSLLGRSRLMTRHTADHLLATTCRPTRASLRLLRSCWALVCHRRAVLSAGSTAECIPRKEEPVAQGPCPFGPSLSTRFGWSVLTTVQKHVCVPTHSDLAHRHPRSGSASACLAPLASPMPLGVRQQHEGGAVSHAP